MTRRLRLTPRPDWQLKVEQQGLTFHTLADGSPYWDESACWEFSAAEIDRLESATSELQQMCLAAGERIVRKNLFERMYIPEAARALIRQTWDAEPPALYARMDLSYNGEAIKLLEYNADTPTSLLEASVIQWHWLEDCFPGADQWNSIHERLVAKWRELASCVSQPICFAYEPTDEDALTIAYLRDTAHQAGLSTFPLLIDEIGWDSKRRTFVDWELRPIQTLFKLYPWEKLVNEPFGHFALATMARGQDPEQGRTQWIEPVWKMLWSNKCLLAILWEMFPEHELLLPCSLSGPESLKSYVRKPVFGREGANVLVVRDGAMVWETDGSYAGGPWVWQATAELAKADGNWAVLGSWLVDGEPAGMGVRESRTPVVRNSDRFVPHIFR